MPNIATKSHNMQISANDKKTEPKNCNCRKKDQCPLQGDCLTTSIVYNAKVDGSDGQKLYRRTHRSPIQIKVQQPQSVLQAHETPEQHRTL